MLSAMKLISKGQTNYKLKDEKKNEIRVHSGTQENDAKYES